VIRQGMDPSWDVSQVVNSPAEKIESKRPGNDEYRIFSRHAFFSTLPINSRWLGLFLFFEFCQHTKVFESGCVPLDFAIGGQFPHKSAHDADTTGFS